MLEVRHTIFVVLFFIFSSFSHYAHADGFAAGTLVRTLEGYVPIEQLKAGDYVVSYNLDYGFLEPDRIIRVQKCKVKGVVVLTVQDEIITASSKQKFFCPLNGDFWVDACYVTESDSVLSNQNKVVQISSAIEIEKATDCYCLTTEYNHNFFILEQEVFVHNMQGIVQNPQAVVQSLINIGEKAAPVVRYVVGGLAAAGAAIFHGQQVDDRSNSKAAQPSAAVQEEPSSTRKSSGQQAPTLPRAAEVVYSNAYGEQGNAASIMAAKAKELADQAQQEHKRLRLAAIAGQQDKVVRHNEVLITKALGRQPGLSVDDSLDYEIQALRQQCEFYKKHEKYEGVVAGVKGLVSKEHKVRFATRNEIPNFTEKSFLPITEHIRSVDSLTSQEAFDLEEQLEGALSTFKGMQEKATHPREAKKGGHWAEDMYDTIKDVVAKTKVLIKTKVQSAAVDKSSEAPRSADTQELPLDTQGVTVPQPARTSEEPQKESNPSVPDNAAQRSAEELQAVAKDQQGSGTEINVERQSKAEYASDQDVNSSVGHDVSTQDSADSDASKKLTNTGGNSISLPIDMLPQLRYETCKGTALANLSSKDFLRVGMYTAAADKAFGPMGGAMLNVAASHPRETIMVGSAVVRLAEAGIEVAAKAVTEKIVIPVISKTFEGAASVIGKCEEFAEIDRLKAAGYVRGSDEQGAYWYKPQPAAAEQPAAQEASHGTAAPSRPVDPIPTQAELNRQFSAARRATARQDPLGLHDIAIGSTPEALSETIADLREDAGMIGGFAPHDPVFTTIREVVNEAADFVQLCNNSGNLQAAADAAQVGYGVHRLGVQGVNGCTASNATIPLSVRQQARQQFYAECTAGFEQLQQRIRAFEDAHAQSVAQAADFVQRVRGRVADIAQRMNADSFGASRPAAAGERSAESAAQDRDAGAEDDEEDAPAEPAVGGQAQGGPSDPEEPEEPNEEGDKEEPRLSAKEFEKRISKMPANERVPAVREMAKQVAKEKGFKGRDDQGVRNVSKSNNNRDIYYDAKSKEYYSVDTQHGRFEVCNKHGKHLREVNFDFKQTKGPDLSGKHNLRVK